jgi:hypothetical protein
MLEYLFISREKSVEYNINYYYLNVFPADIYHHLPPTPTLPHGKGK